MSIVRSCLPVAILLVTLAPAEAAPIIVYSGTPNPFQSLGGYGLNNGMATSWMSTLGFTNVAITADLSALPSATGPITATAYLTTQIGPGTTAAHQIAQATVTLPAFSASNQAVSLFSGLTLGPGQYYLTIASASNGVWKASDPAGWTSTSAFPCTGSGGCVSAPNFPNLAYAALSTNQGLNPFAPARNFIGVHFGSGVAHYAVTGQLAGSQPPPPPQVPEPSSFALMLIGLAAGVRRLRAR